MNPALPSARRAVALAAAVFALSAAAPVAAACLGSATADPPAFPATWLRAYRADFAAPTRLAVDAAGRVYVADPTRGAVVVRDRAGAVVMRKDGLGEPAAIAVDAAGWIYVGDGRRGRVAVFDAAWNPLFDLGAGDGELGRPGDIAIDPASGAVFVTDSERHEVAVFARAVGPRLRTLGGPGEADGLFRAPTGIALAGDDLLVGDQLNYRIQVLDKTTGAFRYCIGNAPAGSFFGSTGGPRRELGVVQGLWADAAGRLFVADAFQGSVRVFDRSSGAHLGDIGSFGDAAGELRVPTDVAIDSDGRLFVAAANNARIEMFGLDPYVDAERFLPAQARLAPAAIDRAAPPATVEVTLRLPGYRAVDVLPASLAIAGLAPDSARSADIDGDGDAELLLSIAGQRLLAALPANGPVEVTTTGTLGPLQFVAPATVALADSGSLDPDGDGVLAAADRCPGTTPGEPIDTNGCSVTQRCPCAGPLPDTAWRNHGAFVRCVRDATQGLVGLARLAPRQAAALLADQAQRPCGR
jgi:DNA-binding beta-propeller fold protein YncE